MTHPPTTENPPTQPAKSEPQPAPEAERPGDLRLRPHQRAALMGAWQQRYAPQARAARHRRRRVIRVLGPLAAAAVIGLAAIPWLTAGPRSEAVLTPPVLAWQMPAPRFRLSRSDARLPPWPALTEARQRAAVPTRGWPPRTPKADTGLSFALPQEDMHRRRQLRARIRGLQRRLSPHPAERDSARTQPLGDAT